MKASGAQRLQFGGKGDHEIWYRPITNRNITVDGEIKSRHMANAILKQAGIGKKF